MAGAEGGARARGGSVHSSALGHLCDEVKTSAGAVTHARPLLQSRHSRCYAGGGAELGGGRIDRPRNERKALATVVVHTPPLLQSYYCA